MPAFKLCQKMKINGFETDLWLTKDNVPVIAHGKSQFSLEKAFNTLTKKEEFIYINDLTWEQLQQYRHLD